MGLGGRRGGAASGTEVAPTEDTVMALLDLLVDPLLPATISSVSRDPPSPAQQATLAKQVQAVVYLYNYYHRKHNPELEYLDFISFCKLAVVLKPSLLAYMKVMQRADISELVNLEKEISLTEKMVMEACDLTKGLETLGTSEHVAGWPISKVAIFLVDSRKENCLLMHSSSTLGVWSVIEKENSLGLAQEAEKKRGTIKKRITKKPQRENKGFEEDGLQQIAFAAVTDAFGCSQSDLKVLETSTVYSLSKEKTAARFYIVQCLESNTEFDYLPIRDVIDSLRGPLLKKEARGWSTTSVVEYFHVLPYADVISNWFVRSQPCITSLDVGPEERNYEDRTTDQSDVGQKVDSCDRVTFSDTTAVEPAVTLVYKKRNTSQKRFSVDESSGFKDKEFSVSHLPNNMEVDELASDIGRSETVNSRSFSVEDRVPAEMNMQSSPITDLVKNEVVGGFQTINEQNREDVKTEDKVVSSSAHGHDLAPFGSGPKGFDKIHEVISSKSSLLSQTASKVLLRKRDMLCLQLRNTQNEIALCDKNRDLISRGGSDALAITLDMLVEGCNDVNVSNAILAQEKAHHHVQEQQKNSSDCLKRKRPFESDSNAQNPCQELEQMCSHDNWASPIYDVSTLDAQAGHQYHVEVKGTDFKLSVTGRVCATPKEAKESAAGSIVSKLRNIMASAS